MITKPTKIKKLLLVLMLLAIGQVSWAATYTWTSASSRDWSDAGNWDLGSVPGSTDDVVIPTSVNGNNPEINFISVTVNNLTVNGFLFVDQSGSSLTINGTATYGAGSDLHIYTGGSVIYNGAVTISSGGNLLIQSGGFANAYTSLVNDGTFGVDAGGNFTVQSGFFTNNGTLNNDGFFHLNHTSFTEPGSIINNTGQMRFSGNGSFTNGYMDVSSPMNTTLGTINTFNFTLAGADGVHCYYSYSPYPNLQVYDEALSLVSGAYNEGWVSYTGTSNVLTPMKGIAANISSGFSIFDFDGYGIPPNNGNQSITVTKTNSCNCADDGWNFVGNPYPSSIDWTSVASHNSGITGSAYVFSSDGTQYGGSWGVINSVGVVAGPASNTIAMTQGFFVKATTASASFTMNNADRSTGYGQTFKTSALANEVRLKLSNTTDTDDIVAYTDANATAGDDQGLDAEKMAAGSTVSIAFKNNNKVYAIDALNEITESTVLPLEVKVTASGNYILTPTLNLSNLKAYLKDAETNTLYDLSSTTPSFNLTGGVIYGTRFSIVFKEENTTGVTTVSENATRIYAAGNRVFVERSSTEACNIIVTNLLGQEIANIKSGDSKTEIQLNIPSLTCAIVKVTEGAKVDVAKVSLNSINK